jgi:hypothetical protein
MSSQLNIAIRTYYWHSRVVPKYKIALRRLINRSPEYFFHTGNAGDIFAQTIIRNEYHSNALNCPEGGKRLLLIGSIAHTLQAGDIICGIGAKTPDIPKPLGEKHAIYGLRGPISYEIFSKAGYDVSNINFLLDPGLLIRFYAENLNHKKPEGAIFIPHYRERNLYYKGLPKGMRFVDIDNHPMELAKQILESELVYASSLHGIIFAHALNRPAILVAPKTEEPILKYQDYFSSINQPTPTPLEDISEIRLISKPTSPITLNYQKSDFVLPSIEELIKLGIAEE